jgi:hypothetical protein
MTKSATKKKKAQDIKQLAQDHTETKLAELGYESKQYEIVKILQINI